nr:Orphan Rhodopsin-like G protein-coupled receptor [Hymenolepis microstoma]
MNIPIDTTFGKGGGLNFTSAASTQDPPLCPNGLVDVLTRYNGSDLLMYSRFMPPVNDVVEKVSYPLWCTLGLPGSILSIYIWSKKNMLKQGSVAAAVYQAGLGWVDLCFFLVQIMWYLHTPWKLRTLDHTVVCEGFAIANYLLQYASPMLTLVFTVERYIAICFPFRAGARNFGNSCKSAVHVVLATILFCALLASVQGVFFTINDGNCGLREDFEKVGEPEWLFYTGWTLVTELLMFGLVPIICLILNILVIRALHKLSHEDLSGSKRDRLLPHSPTSNSCTRFSTTSSVFLPQLEASIKEHQIKQSSTLTLLCVSFYLIIAHFSVAVMVVLYCLLPMGDLCMTDEQIAKDPQWRRHFRFVTVRSLIDCFGTSHYAAKFYIYLATSAVFREQCAQIFCCCRRQQRSLSLEPNSYHDHTTVSLVNGGSNLANHGANSLAGSSNNRSGNSTASALMPPRRISASSIGSRVFGNGSGANGRRIPRTRPPSGLSRTVLTESGERVQLKIS